MPPLLVLLALLPLIVPAIAQEVPKPPAALAGLQKLLGATGKLPDGHQTRFQPAAKPVLLLDLADSLGRDADQRTLLRELMVKGAKAVEEQLAAAGHPNEVSAGLAFALAAHWSIWKDAEVPEAATEALLAQVDAALGADLEKLGDRDKQKAYEHCVGLGVFSAAMKEGADGDKDALAGIRTFSRQVLQGLLGMEPERLELSTAGLRLATATRDPVPASSGYAFRTTDFTEGWVSTAHDDHVLVTKDGIEVILTFVEKFDITDITNRGTDVRHHYWDTVVARYFATGDTHCEGGGALSDFSEYFIEGPGKDRRNGALRHVALMARVVKFTGTLSLILVSAPDRETFWRQFPNANRKFDSDLLPMYAFNKFAVGPTDLPGSWVSGGNGVMLNWYSATTGQSVGATASSSSDRFAFGSDGSYSSLHKGATGVVGALQTFQEQYHGRYTVTEWSLTLTDRTAGRTETFEAWFECVRGGRLLHLKDKAQEMVLGRDGGAAGATAPPAAGDGEVVRQWASSARASSEYGTDGWSAARATGAPDVPAHGDDARAWATKLADGGDEWLEVSFAKPVCAHGVRIVQSHCPGAIVRIDGVDATGNAVAVWHGPDHTAYERGKVGVLEVQFDATRVPIAQLKIVLDTRLVGDWNEIDAVELLGRAAGSRSGR